MTSRGIKFSSNDDERQQLLSSEVFEDDFEVSNVRSNKRKQWKISCQITCICVKSMLLDDCQYTCFMKT